MPDASPAPDSSASHNSSRSDASCFSSDDPTRRRNVEILRDYAQREPSGKSHRLELRFLRSPLEILGDGEVTKALTVRVARFSESAAKKLADGGNYSWTTTTESAQPSTRYPPFARRR